MHDITTAHALELTATTLQAPAHAYVHTSSAQTKRMTAGSRGSWWGWLRWKGKHTNDTHDSNDTNDTHDTNDISNTHDANDTAHSQDTGVAPAIIHHDRKSDAMLVDAMHVQHDVCSRLREAVELRQTALTIRQAVMGEHSVGAAVGHTGLADALLLLTKQACVSGDDDAILLQQYVYETGCVGCKLSCISYGW